ncbi:hypothetical protein [Halomonas campaniensis]|uniref:hypothetical protein n=1 Tax=Halomonas campaniensis TaxID=213554 RepID=UPI003970B9BF
MRTIDEARELAATMVAIGRHAGRTVRAVLSNMDEPLGAAVGHALEVREAVATLRGAGPPDLRELVVTLAGELLEAAGLVTDRAEVEAALDDGRALPLLTLTLLLAPRLALLARGKVHDQRHEESGPDIALPAQHRRDQELQLMAHNALKALLDGITHRPGRRLRGSSSCLGGGRRLAPLRHRGGGRRRRAGRRRSSGGGAGGHRGTRCR